MSLKGKTAIVGVGELNPAKTIPGRTLMGLMVEATRKAIEDAGLRKEDIDGILAEPPPEELGWWGFPMSFAEYLMINPRFASTVGMAGATAAAMVWRASAAINAGLCDTVLCALGAARETSRFGKDVVLARPHKGITGQFEEPYGPEGTNSLYALIAMRHKYEFGTTDEQRALVAVYERTNACANPNAIFYGKPITVQDVLNSRLVADPLHLLEVVMPCAGAAAIIVTSAERAKSLRNPPIYLLGAGEYSDRCSIPYVKTLTTSGIKVAAAKAFQMAGVGPGDIKLVSVYDAYTHVVLITLEDAGFCKKGEGGSFVQDTNLTYKGKLPVNTHGGMLSFGQAGLAGGMSHVTEAVLQLRGQARERQVPDCNLAYINGSGGIMSEECSLILGKGH